jgi:hypothetical protein
MCGLTHTFTVDSSKQRTQLIKYYLQDLDLLDGMRLGSCRNYY